MERNREITRNYLLGFNGPCGERVVVKGDSDFRLTEAESRITPVKMFQDSRALGRNETSEIKTNHVMSTDYASQEKLKDESPGSSMLWRQGGIP